MCDLEFKILNKKIALDLLKVKIQYAKSLIEKLSEIPELILSKSNQIS